MSNVNEMSKSLEQTQPDEKNQEKLANIEYKNKLKQLQKVLFEWSKSVDINCYHKMFEYRPNFKAQFIWLFILLVSTGATFYFISKSIMDYLNYDVVSQTNIIYEIPTQFPTVTFCDNNPFSSNASQSFMETIALSNGISVNSSYTSDLSKLKATSVLVSDDERKSFGLNLDQTIQCSFRNTDCKNDLHWYWTWEYGNCWQFNSGLNLINQKINLKSTYKEGSASGLSVLILLKLNINKYSQSSGDGVVVFVHNSSFKPVQSVYVEPGKITDIQVERIFIQKRPLPYSDCEDLTFYSSDLYDYIIKQGQVYRQQDCFDLCVQKLALTSCECYFPGYQNLNTQLRPCLNLTDWACLGKQYFSISLTECQKMYCPLECNTIKYDLTLSSLVFPSQTFYDNVLDTNEIRLEYQSIVNQTLTFDSVRSHAVNFNIYYPSLQYTLITEKEKTSISDLFSQMGGALGLFVSFSIFTLFEFMELLILIIYDGFFKKISNKIGKT